MNNIDQINQILIKKSLNASAERSRVIAHNISNINTKGFKASKISFEDKLKEALDDKAVKLKVTNQKHIGFNNNISSVNHEVVTDTTTSMRLDGNNVDIDAEMTNLAANNILFNALISQANSRISMRRYVTSEGRR